MGRPSGAELRGRGAPMARGPVGRRARSQGRGRPPGRAAPRATQPAYRHTAGRLSWACPSRRGAHRCSVRRPSTAFRCRQAGRRFPPPVRVAPVRVAPVRAAPVRVAQVRVAARRCPQDAAPRRGTRARSVPRRRRRIRRRRRQAQRHHRHQGRHGRRRHHRQFGSASHRQRRLHSSPAGRSHSKRPPLRPLPTRRGARARRRRRGG